MAKPHLDVGMMCSDVDASRAFYEGWLGLSYEELLEIGGGMHQHRLGLRGGVSKLNSVRNPLLAAGLGARPMGDASWSVGSTTLTLVHDPSARHGLQRAVGFRYLTVQVFDVFTEHERLLSVGWSEGAAPIR